MTSSVVTWANSDLFPAEFAVKGESGQVVGGDFEKEFAWGGLGEVTKKRGSDAAMTQGRIDGEVQDFDFGGSRGAPGAESGGFAGRKREENAVVGIIAHGPLGGFGTRLLDAGDGGIVGLRSRPD